MAERRRGKGEGSIYRRPDGLWVGQLDAGYRAGARVRRTFYGKTRREVQEKLLAARSQIAPGVSAGRQTVGQFLGHWLEQVAKPSVRPRTYEFYAGKVRLYVLPSLGGLALSRLSPQQIQGLYGELLLKGLSPRTVHHVHAVLHRALGYAERWNLLSRSPVALVEPPRSRRKEMASLDVAQARTLLEVSRGDRLHPLWVVMLSTGLRIGEALALRWSRVDLERSILAVQSALQRQRPGGGLVFVEPKTVRSRRPVQLPSIAVDALREHRRSQAEERLMAGPRWQDNDLLFCWRIGTPLEPSRVNREFKAILERAGLPRIRLHDLRHTTASLLLAQGVHEKLVQELLGHGSISLTMDTYSHVLPSLHRTAAEAMDRLLGADRQ